MGEAFRDCGEVILVKDLKEAVLAASKEAKTGEVVLFSPACSSFDTFKDYAERGEVFIKLVQQL